MLVGGRLFSDKLKSRRARRLSEIIQHVMADREQGDGAFVLELIRQVIRTERFVDERAYRRRRAERVVRIVMDLMLAVTYALAYLGVNVGYLPISPCRVYRHGFYEKVEALQLRRYPASDEKFLDGDHFGVGVFRAFHL